MLIRTAGMCARSKASPVPAVAKAMRFFAENTNDKIDYRGYDCWKYGLYGVCLAEYYLKTREKWVLKELGEINRWLVKAQFEKAYRRGQGAGGWGHRPSGRPCGRRRPRRRVSPFRRR